MMRCPRPRPTVLKWPFVLPSTMIFGNPGLGSRVDHISTSSKTTLASQTRGSHIIRTISDNSTRRFPVLISGMHDTARGCGCSDTPASTVSKVCEKGHWIGFD